MKQETKFQNKFLEKLKAIPNSWWVKYTARSIRGIPDILGCVNGTFVAIELKKDFKETKKRGRNVLQKYNLEKIKLVGGESYLVWPENSQEVLDEINFLANYSPFFNKEEAPSLKN